MGSVKSLALVGAEQGEAEAWLALKSVPDEAARQALALIARQSPEIAMRTLALVAGAGAGRGGDKKGLEFRGALYIADREWRTGERFGLHFFWDPGLGPIDSVIGIRDRVTKNIGAVEYRFRPLTEAEAKLNDLQLTGDKPDLAVAVEITVQRDRTAAVNAYRSDLVAYKLALEVAKLRADILGHLVAEANLPVTPTIQYAPVTGIGIVLGEEMYDGVYIYEKAQGKWGTYDKKVGKHPREKWGVLKAFDFVNYTYHEKAETRALRAGFRRVPGALAEHEQAMPVGEGISLDLPDAASVGREQLLTAIEKEAARSAQASVIENAPDKDALLETMRAGAYGSAPAAELAAIRSVSDIVNSLMREAAERDGTDPQTPKANGLEAVWEAYAEHGFGQGEAKAITNIIFPGGIETHGQAAALYFWLREPDPADATGKRYRKCEAATAEALAVLTSATMTDEDGELPFDDEPEEDEDA